MISRAPLTVLAAALAGLSGNGRPAPGPVDTLPVPLEATSSLRLHGGSTVKDWTCTTSSMEAEVNPVSAVRPAATGGESRPLGELRVPVATLDCGNGHMESDLRKAIGASEHPDIDFRLTGYRLEPASQGVRVTAHGRLSLAGTTRDVDVAVRAEPTGDGGWRAVGSTDLLMTDFGIRPPSALFGLIKAEDRVVVVFDLRTPPGALAGVRELIASRAPARLPPLHLMGH